ncbi:MAG TPA: tetratricopeptide repeat protein [Acidobacteria bacterium]|jgi:regulator of sirC expression with transglutaminase-like and TPR domain|nr:tetratricopeptide repeat protein [Acidobacteriota bacterium]HIN69729.1 tetratricopeptide repeat protein [Acidobacteriota bacterium]
MINIDKLAREFANTVSGQTPDLAHAALLIARLEHPLLNPKPSLECLDRMGVEARQRLADGGGKTQRTQFEILSRYLFRERGFTGNPNDHEDPRNSCLNQVLDRRTGIPVTLGIVFLEVAKRAGVRAAGISFPGHFLVRLQAESSERDQLPLVIDPSNSGRIMDEGDCRELLHQHLGDDAEFDLRLLEPASSKQILVRVLENLKRMYVRLRSFPQARDVTELLLAVNPSGAVDLRDRGLLAYHLRDFSGALRDLEAYLHITGRTGNGDVLVDRQTEHEQIWEHIKMLRRRVASLN